LTLTELAQLLEAAGINVQEWGAGKSKTVRHLLDEVNVGEISLEVQSEGLLRRVQVVGITVTSVAGGSPQILKEDRQVFTANGRERRRTLDSSVAEKMQPGEDPVAAARRGLQEELGISNPVELVAAGVRTRGPEDSQSYPGLSTLYTLRLRGRSSCASLQAGRVHRKIIGQDYILRLAPSGKRIVFRPRNHARSFFICIVQGQGKREAGCSHTFHPES